MKRTRFERKAISDTNYTMTAYRQAQAAKKAEQKRLDIEWSKAVRQRDQRCRRCSGAYELHAHHIIRRAIQETRHDLDNGVTLCADCHAWAHSHQIEARAQGFIRSAFDG